MHWFFIGYLAGHSSGHAGGGFPHTAADPYIGAALMLVAVGLFVATIGRVLYAWAFNKRYPSFWPR